MTTFVFDLSGDQSNTEYTDPTRHGGLRAEVRFREALAHPITCFVHSEYDNTIEIDQDRRVSLDVTTWFENGNESIRENLKGEPCFGFQGGVCKRSTCCTQNTGASACSVINTDPIALSGEHWIAIPISFLSSLYFLTSHTRIPRQFLL